MSRQNRAGFATLPNEDADAPIIDSLLSTRAGSSLSARQGNVLYELIQDLDARSAGLTQKGLTITTPSGAEKVPLFYTTERLTLAAIFSIVTGITPSITFSIHFGTGLDQPGLEAVSGGIVSSSATSGTTTTSFTNAVIPAGSWIWLTTTAISGTVTALNVTLLFGGP